MADKSRKEMLEEIELLHRRINIIEQLICLLQSKEVKNER